MLLQVPTGKEESDPTYSYNYILYFISKIIYKLPFVWSSNLISKSKIFKLLSSGTILQQEFIAVFQMERDISKGTQ